jgi:ankyrin repeat protein
MRKDMKSAIDKLETLLSLIKQQHTTRQAIVDGDFETLQAIPEGFDVNFPISDPRNSYLPDPDPFLSDSWSDLPHLSPVAFAITQFLDNKLELATVMQMIRILVSKGASVNVPFRSYASLVGCLMQQGPDKIPVESFLPAFLELGADPNSEGYNDIPILLCLLAVKNRVMTKLLLEKGASVSGKGIHGLTPLHATILCVPQGVTYEHVVKQLLALKADIHAYASNGMTAITLALATKNQPVAALLSAAGAKPQTKLDTVSSEVLNHLQQFKLQQFQWNDLGLFIELCINLADNSTITTLDLNNMRFDAKYLRYLEVALRDNRCIVEIHFCEYAVNYAKTSKRSPPEIKYLLESIEGHLAQNRMLRQNLSSKLVGSCQQTLFKSEHPSKLQGNLPDAKVFPGGSLLSLFN